MTEKEMKELNKRLIENLPEIKLRQFQMMRKLKKQEELSKRKERKEIYAQQIKENIISKAK